MLGGEENMICLMWPRPQHDELWSWAWYKTWQTRDNGLSFACLNIYMISLNIKIYVLCTEHPHKQILCQSFCPLGLYPRWSETFYGTRVAQYFSLLYDCFCCCLQKHSVLNVCCIVIKEPHQVKEKRVKDTKQTNTLGNFLLRAPMSCCWFCPLHELRSLIKKIYFRSIQNQKANEDL